MADDSPQTNAPDLSVSDLAAQLRRTIETNFDHVRVRGELGRVTIARSGHLYADLKDDKAVLNTVMWKGQVGRLPFQPEEGLEVVATGRLSTYPGRSNYQLIAETMRPAGAGALMALLEERKKKLAAEGLFAPEHKKRLPFLPARIGVVTSPTGAVIRDILHRIRDRFPVPVLVWPVLVQGDLAAGQIEAGIRGFNAMPASDRPDLVIVARGGGSIEDLWPFNEEAVVRAAFESEIPLISAVGHETDTTLIDYVADARAPTPTGAAEIAVPVRADLALALGDHAGRLRHALIQRAGRARDRLRAARLPNLQALIAARSQRLDVATLRLGRVLGAFLAAKRAPFVHAAAGLRLEAVRVDLRRRRDQLKRVAVRARPALLRSIEHRRSHLAAVSKQLNALSYTATLARGFAVVRDSAGALVRSRNAAVREPLLTIAFADGDVQAAPAPPAPPKPAKPKSAKTAVRQGQLFE